LKSRRQHNPRKKRGLLPPWAVFARRHS
jgi:hypothetical protein